MFDWKTVDEDQWDEVVAEKPPSPPRKRPWKMLAAVLLLAAVVGGGIYGQLRQRIAENKQALTADLAASQTVITLAANQRDVELFRNLVARTDYEWARTQDRLIERGLFLDRTIYGLALGDTNMAEVVDVLTSPQQTRTRVTTAYPYTTPTSETVWLYHVAVYEQRGGRWRLAPPDEAFWGETRTLNVGSLILVVPAREEAIWQRVLPHLQAAVADLCQQNIPCPSGMPIQLSLSTDPATLVEMVGREATYFRGSGFGFILPALTLFGLPSDEAATTAVAHAYAAQIAIGLIARYEGYASQRAIDQVLLERRLDEVGVRPWPLQPADYARYFKEPFPINEIPFQTITHPRLTERDWWRLYLLGDYLSYVRQTVPDVLTQSRLNPQGWLGEPALNPSGAGRDLFLDFLAARGGLENRPSPIPLPSQSVVAICHHETEAKQLLYKYHPLEARWEPARGVVWGNFLQALPPSLAMLGTGESYMLFEEEGYVLAPTVRETAWSAPAGDSLFIQLPFGLVGQHLGIEGTQLGLAQIDLTACGATSCPFYLLPGYPSWSPSGDWLVAAENFDPSATAFATTASLPPTPTLHLADGAGVVRETLGEGYAPFWLDEGTLGWARPRPSGGVDVVQRPLADTTHVPSILLSWEELAAHLPPNYVSTPFMVWHIAPLPQNPDLLLLFFTADAVANVPEIAWQGATHLLLYEWRTHTWRKTVGLLGKAWGVDWSPDGRLLLLHATRGYNSVLEMPTLAVRDSWEHTIPPSTSPHSYLWSADSQWLLHLNNGFLTLTAPAYNYQHIVRTAEMRGCLGVGWE